MDGSTAPCSGAPAGASPPVVAVPTGRASRSSGIFPSLLVVIGILVVVLGGYVAAGVLSETVGPPVTVGGVVRVSPLSGWEVARRFTDPPGVRLTRGGGNLDVFAVPFGGDASAVARWYVTRALGPTAVRLSVSPTTVPVRLASGLEGVRFHYIGLFGRGQAPVEGEVTAFATTSGAGVVFDTWAAQGLLQYVVDDARTMVQDAVMS